MQQLDLFATEPITQTGFKYRRRLYNDKQQYLYTVIPTKDGYTLNRVQPLAKDIGLLRVDNLGYERFKTEHGLTEVLPKDVKERSAL